MAIDLIQWAQERVTESQSRRQAERMAYLRKVASGRAGPDIDLLTTAPDIDLACERAGDTGVEHRPGAIAYARRQASHHADHARDTRTYHRSGKWVPTGAWDRYRHEVMADKWRALADYMQACRRQDFADARERWARAHGRLAAIEALVADARAAEREAVEPEPWQDEVTPET